MQNIELNYTISGILASGLLFSGNTSYIQIINLVSYYSMTATNSAGFISYQLTNSNVYFSNSSITGSVTSYNELATLVQIGSGNLIINLVNTSYCIAGYLADAIGQGAYTLTFNLDSLSQDQECVQCN